VVAGLDENRLTGYAGLPINHNPYLETFRDPTLVAGALSPLSDTYSIVFDSATRAGAGRFTFRLWVNDVTPPSLRMNTRTVRRGQPLRITAIDAGAGIYPEAIRASIDGEQRGAAFTGHTISILTHGLRPGTHRLRLRVSDYQEAKNTENVARILPNTRTATFAFRIR
jgi:hypothetical protein